MSKPVFLYNTLGRRLERFTPLSGPRVGIYTCGPTVYSQAHIGNLRAYFFSDLLRRTLTFAGYEVRHVMNITDVGHLTSDEDTGDDKVEAQARRLGLDAWELSRHYSKLFLRDMSVMGNLTPHVVCRATEHIDEQIQLIRQLELKGFVYETRDGVYFDSAKDSNYGELARLNVEGLRSGIRVEVGQKRRPTDFALWKFSPSQGKRQMEWDSPWGRGFPGWHIECSAMSIKYLGEQFDIHTGGVDHIPVHHTNEIAQSEAATGKRPFVKYWLHEEFLSLGEELKMGKSSGETLTLEVLQSKGFDSLAYRYFLLTAHYRKPQKFRYDLLDSAQRALERLRRRYIEFSALGSGSQRLSRAGADLLNAFEASIYRDLGAPEALAVLWAVVDSKLEPGEKVQLLDQFDRVLGLQLKGSHHSKEAVPREIMDLLEQRQRAREALDWQGADRLRKQIEKSGYQILDTPSGPRLERKK